MVAAAAAGGTIAANGGPGAIGRTAATAATALVVPTVIVVTAGVMIGIVAVRADRNGRGDRRDQPDRSRRADRGDRPDEERRRHRPHFTPPPEVPQRPKPKRLRPGKQHRMDVLASLPEEQRPVAELAQQGMPAVRQRLREDNARLRAEGKPPMPEAGVLKMAEELIPRLRVADWLDRAEAAQRQLAHLDLRDLRSVVASADDPVVARDESTRRLGGRAEAGAGDQTGRGAGAVARPTSRLRSTWGGSYVRCDCRRCRPRQACRSRRRSPIVSRESSTAALQPTDGPDRWAALLEAAAFSPVRSLVVPTAPVEQRSDELMATVRRLAPLLPQVAAIYEIEVRQGAPMPKPLRPTNRRPEPKKAGPRPEHRDRPERAAPPAAERAESRRSVRRPPSPRHPPSPSQCESRAGLATERPTGARAAGERRRTHDGGATESEPVLPSPSRRRARMPSDVGRVRVVARATDATTPVGPVEPEPQMRRAADPSRPSPPIREPNDEHDIGRARRSLREPEPCHAHRLSHPMM